VNGAPAERRVIVNADDLGWTDGVNAGIARAHREGIVTSATLAANMPAAAAGAEEAAAMPDLGVGVHLNACQGPALSARAREVLAGPDGVMNLTAGQVIRRRLLRPRATLSAIEAEFDAQIAFCLDHGLKPTHADTHRHLHAWGSIFRLVADLCRRYDIPFIRRHGERLPTGRWPVPERRQQRVARVLTWLGARRQRQAPEWFATEGTWGVAHTGRIDEAFLIEASRRLPAGTVEIMVHPGLSDGLDPRQTRLIATRRTELEALCDPAVARALDKAGVERTHYGRLAEQR